jgi:hypothetical protein
MNSIAQRRLHNQCISHTTHRRADEVITWFGAIQAQDYAAAKWALALRTQGGTTDVEIERLFNEGKVLRTHALRRTWHFVTPKDIGWMLDFTGARIQKSLAYGYRNFELDTAIRTRAADIFERALRDGQCLTRTQLGKELAAAGIVAKGVQLALLTVHAELERIICSGPRRGKDLTYGLMSFRAPRHLKRSPDEALAEITRRYFQSHGPATIRDFVWWSGLTTGDAKRGIEINGIRSESVAGLQYWSLNGAATGKARTADVHLLPIYDEYLVAYRDLEAVPRLTASFGILPQALIVDGQFAGTWKRKKSMVEIACGARVSKLRWSEAVSRYGRFLQQDVEFNISQ